MPVLLKLRDNKVYDLDPTQVFLIGRASHCTDVIEDVQISREHVTIFFEDNQWQVRDKSSNGVFINDLKMRPKSQTVLNLNDYIQLAHYVYQFRLAPPQNLLSDPNAEVIVIDEEGTYNVPHIPQEPQTHRTNSPHRNAAGPLSPNQGNNSMLNGINEEVSCSICTELYINAMILNCGHSFCELCIFKWRKNSKFCPTCRQIITNVTNSVALNNVISLMVAKYSTAEQDQRASTVEAHRLELIELNKPPPAAARRRLTRGGAGGPPARRARGSGRTTRSRSSRGRQVRPMDIIDLNADTDSDEYEGTFHQLTNNLFRFLSRE